MAKNSVEANPSPYFIGAGLIGAVGMFFFSASQGLSTLLAGIRALGFGFFLSSLVFTIIALKMGMKKGLNLNLEIAKLIAYSLAIGVIASIPFYFLKGPDKVMQYFIILTGIALLVVQYYMEQSYQKK